MNFFTFTAVALTYIKRIWSADIYTRWAIFFRRGVHGINFVSFFFNIKSDLRAKLTRWLTLSRDFTSIKFSYVYASAYACVASRKGFTHETKIWVFHTIKQNKDG